MILSLLSVSPLTALIWLGAIIAALTVHEFSHALAGSLKGDQTAELSGRLTLNPLAHLDPWGFLMLLVVGFGWAKPVPYNPYNLKNPTVDGLIIALAGPFSNLASAALSGVLLRINAATEILPTSNLLIVFLTLFAIINLFLMFFNLIPVDPLDGSKVLDVLLRDPKYLRTRMALKQYGPTVLFGLILLSFLPGLNVFSWISVPSFITCDLLTGQSCAAALLGSF